MSDRESEKLTERNFILFPSAVDNDLAMTNECKAIRMLISAGITCCLEIYGIIITESETIQSAVYDLLSKAPPDIKTT